MRVGFLERGVKAGVSAFDASFGQKSAPFP
jgi:hypothetical protein